MKKALTYDDGKPPLANLPWHGLREVALVQLYGKRKYKNFYNYRLGLEASRTASCAIRHISEWMDRNELDAESGRNHLAHACCRLLFLLENIHDGKLIDDRYEQPKEKHVRRRERKHAGPRPQRKGQKNAGHGHAEKRDTRQDGQAN